MTGARVLVVEDDPVFQEVLKKRLENEGFEVSVASDGREGLQRIVSFEPDLVLSDWMMPHVDGLELCQAVKTGLREQAPYFILLTARSEMSDRVLALDTGADDYVVKPCEHSDILSRVRAGARLVWLARELRASQAEVAALRAELAQRVA